MRKQAQGRHVVLCSGGADSVTLAYHVAVYHPQDAVTLLAFDYGQKHTRELDCVHWNARVLACDVTIVDLKFMPHLLNGASALVAGSELSIPHIQDAMGDPQPASYVPFRNMLMLTLAAARAEATGAATVWYGAQRHDQYGYWDTTSEFVAGMDDIFSMNRKNRITLRAPFVSWRKSRTIQHGLSLGVDFAHTWSCYEGRSRPCGVCPTCSERLAAFKEIARTDPLSYENDAQYK